MVYGDDVQVVRELLAQPEQEQPEDTAIDS
jgi:hypothetical protein